MKKIKLHFIISILFINTLLIAGSPGKFHPLAMDITKKSDEIFIQNKICSSFNECNKKELIFYDLDNAGVAFYIYGVKDVKSIEKIISYCVSKYFMENKKVNIEVNAYHQTHRALRGTYFTTPYIQLTLKREK